MEGEAPVLIHRVADLDRAKAELAGRGLEVDATFEIPPGNCATVRSPGGQRIGIYEEARPEITSGWRAVATSSPTAD